ncbi:MAG TPA: DNA polymerase III subunit chi [Rhodospirillaceae bacterium]|nr:DNA polymerase III subunit chi [Rhodospirillaceae bacterium]
MSEIRFYHLTRKRLEQALPELLEKTVERKWRAVVLTDSQQRAEYLAQFLWTYRGDSFLPHGAARDGGGENQPLWITDKDENPNGADVLFLIDGATTQSVPSYRLVCELFDGNNEQAVSLARQRWAAYKNESHTLSYWKQTEKGWEK